MISLIIFALITAFSLGFESSLGDGICVTHIREITHIPIGPYGRTTPKTRHIPIEICCDGYQNSSGICTPVCDPYCVHGTCINPNECKCHEGFIGKLCDDVNTFCTEGFWGYDCENECECNGSNCTALEGICTCQAGFTGEHCNFHCDNTHFGVNCNETCDCHNGICDGVTGNCSCYPGFMGKNCSMVCPEGKYGSNCTETCKCQNDAICNGTNGSCQCKPGFQGEFCDNTCSKGFWGLDCGEMCSCNKTDVCDPKTGNCFCENGFTGEQCTEPCKAGFCGFACSEKCPCLNGICSVDNCTCDCPPMMYGTDCSESCNCNKTNTEKCNQTSGKCECKPGWIGPTCEEPCQKGFYGDNCEKECTCNWENTRGNQRDNGICMCKEGFTGKNCDNKCDLGYYGSNCSKVCYYTGLDNYICDPVEGDICSSLYTGATCDVCKCGTNGSCLKDKCDCNAGYYGTWCQERCSITKYGKNCAHTCECSTCRATDGFCKCQEGFKGENCSDYCPIDYYDNEKNVCINLNEESTPWFSNKIILFCAIGGTTTLALITILIIYFKCKNQDKSYGMVNLRAPKIFLPDPINHQSINTNTYERDEPQYETIPDTVLPTYQCLAREDEIPRHAIDPNYFLRYETPRHVPQPDNIEMYAIPKQEYVFLNRNSIGPRRNY